VSQFTLYGSAIKGSKPDFHMSMKSETSKQMYHDFLDRLKKAYQPDRIKGNQFLPPAALRKRKKKCYVDAKCKKKEEKN
jgi:hypothetical protein